MRFPRLADGRRSYNVIERSDGVRYRVRQGVAGPRLPHDAVHLVVERELGDDGGFWGAVSAGAVFASMDHLGGRRQPHGRERARQVVRDRSGRLHRAELMADLVERVASDGITAPGQVARLASEVLSTLPDARVDTARILAAADALRETSRRRAALTPGEDLVFDWPGRR